MKLEFKKGDSIECVNNKYVESKLDIGGVYVVSESLYENVTLAGKSSQMFGVSRFKLFAVDNDFNNA